MQDVVCLIRNVTRHPADSLIDDLCAFGFVEKVVHPYKCACTLISDIFFESLFESSATKSDGRLRQS